MTLDSPLLQRWQPAQAWLIQRLPAAVTATASILAGIAVAELMWTLLPAPADSQWTPAPIAATGTAAPARKPDVNAIVRAHLFGVHQPVPAATALPQSAPDTHLSLTLMGIFAGSRKDESRALIAHQGGLEEPYAIGDDVTRGVMLQAIFPDRVILAREGRLETLRLDKDKPSSAVAPSPPVTETASAAGSLQELSRIREQIVKDPSKASEYIRVQPANQNGQLRGYRIYPGRDRSVFNNAGLRPGDLVTAVNGVELNDAGRALQLLGELAQTTQLNLTVERGGQNQTLNLNLN